MIRKGGVLSYRSRKAKRLFVGFLLSCTMFSVGLLGLSSASAATPPKIVMYQGRLLNANSVPVSDATASISFALYDSLTGGTCLWSNISSTCAATTARTVTLTDGLFSEPLGDTTQSYAAIPATVFADNASVYLEVVVNTETLSPRKQFLAAPYALNSDALDGYETTLAGATSAMIPVFDANGHLIITGAPQGSTLTDASLIVNPATGDVSADELLFGVGVNNSSRFTVDAEGDVIVGGNIIVGGATLAAPFSVDSTTGDIRFGNANTFNPTLTFYATDGASGTITYDTSDTWQFTDADFSHVGRGSLPTTSGSTARSFRTQSTVAGTSGADLTGLKIYDVDQLLSYSATEGSGSTSHTVSAANSQLNISGAATSLTYGYAVRGEIQNTSTNSNLLESSGFLSGVFGTVAHDGTGTLIADVRGVVGQVSASSGTISDAYGTFGMVGSSAGTIVRAYGLYGQASAAGTTRYGLFATASGGTTNYAGYFSGNVHIDANSTADTVTIAADAGDLFVGGDLESHGSTLLGDSASSSATFQFASAVTSGGIVNFILDGAVGATGVNIGRANNGASEFTGTLFAVNQSDVGSGSTGTAAKITQLGTGSAIGLHVVQSTTSAHVANATGANALVIDVYENGSSDDVIILRSDADNDGTGTDTEFRVTSAGDAYADGAFTGGGADFAEYFPTSDSALTHSLLACVDGARSSTVRACLPGAQNIIGVVSTNPAFIGNNIGDGTEDLRGNANYRLIGLVGQVDTRVSAEHGAIAIGDPVSMSSSTLGVGAKAQGPSRIVGFALESLASGTGTIRVLVQPHWYAGDVLTREGSATQVTGSLAIAASTLATASQPTMDSASLVLRGSAWNGATADTWGMTLNTTVSAMDEYRLSVKNSDNIEVASVSRSGDLSLAGKFYPSDRGAMQGSAYIYYDGSAGISGNFMRTNASGWATGSYDFAEMFPSSDALVPGELVEFGEKNQHVSRSGGTEYSRRIVGIVSTKPGFLAGENLPGHYPIALAGRVPTFVTTENGAIHIGDPLTTSNRPGYAMKATAAGPVVGYAAEALASGSGKIVVYVNVSYYSGAPVETGPGSENSVSLLADNIAQFNVTGSLNFQGGQLTAIGSLSSSTGAWRLEQNGDLKTSGRLIELVQTLTGAKVETYAVTSRETTVQLAGTVTLQHGRGSVRFSDVDTDFTSIIDANPTYRAFVTPYGATGMLYVTNRTVDGFDIVESGAASSGVDVDWMVLAYRRDFAPVDAFTQPTPFIIPVITVPSVSEGGSQPQDLVAPVVDEASEDEAPVTVVSPDETSGTSDVSSTLEDAANPSANDIVPESSSSSDVPVADPVVDVQAPTSAPISDAIAPAPTAEPISAPAQESAPAPVVAAPAPAPVPAAAPTTSTANETL